MRRLTDSEARATVDAAWVSGVRYFDTAPHYGLGLSERRLGTALSMRPRDEFVVSSKVGRILERLDVIQAFTCVSIRSSLNERCSIYGPTKPAAAGPSRRQTRGGY